MDTPGTTLGKADLPRILMPAVHRGAVALSPLVARDRLVCKNSWARLGLG